MLSFRCARIFDDAVTSPAAMPLLGYTHSSIAFRGMPPIIHANYFYHIALIYVTTAASLL